MITSGTPSAGDTALPGDPWSADVAAFGDAEAEALAAGDLERATDVNVAFWLPDAREPVRAAIRERSGTRSPFRRAARRRRRC